MRRSSALSIFWIAVLSIALAVATSAAEPPLSPTQLEKLQHKALDGDEDAALRVAWHFDQHGTIEESNKWTTIAAENGAATAMVNLSMALYWTDTKPDECRRARFWLRRALTVAKSEGERSDIRMRIRNTIPAYERCVSQRANRR